MGEATASCLVSKQQGGDEVLSVTHRIVGRFFEANEVSAQLQAEYDALYPEVLGATIDEAVREAGLHPECISKILPHNVNTYSWRSVMRHSAVDATVVYTKNIPRFGHCFGADPFINLHDAKRDGSVRPGEYVVLTSAGLGATFVASVVKVGSCDVVC
nr:3-oxoacyl-[acyl-carrier-protein] synthase III C-terminal domain-containing protein [Flexivirga oryzae]